MTDIVERLHQYRPRDEWGDPVQHSICNEAADEIERLEARATAAEATVTALQENMAKAAEALEASADQLARAHDDAFKQCAGYGLVTSDGRDFSCLQLNKCGEQASRARTALSSIKGAK